MKCVTARLVQKTFAKTTPRGLDNNLANAVPKLSRNRKNLNSLKALKAIRENTVWFVCWYSDPRSL